MLVSMGLTLAFASGLLLGTLWVEATFPYLVGWVLQLHLPYVESSVLLLLSIAVCVVASLVPARAAVRLAPGEAIRYE